MPVRVSARVCVVVLSIILTPITADAQSRDGAPASPQRSFESLSPERQQAYIDQLKQDWIGLDQLSADELRAFAAEELASQQKQRPLGWGASLLRSMLIKVSSLINRKIDCLSDEQRRQLNAQLEAIRKEFEDGIGQETNAAAREVVDRTAAETTRRSEEVRRRSQGGDAAGALNARNQSIEAHKRGVAELRAMFGEQGMGRINFLSRIFGKAADEAEAKIERLPECDRPSGGGLRG